MEDFAREDGTTLNQFIVTAVAEKLASLKTADYFSGRASRADVSAFGRFMSRPDGVLPRPEGRWDDISTAEPATENALPRVGPD